MHPLRSNSDGASSASEIRQVSEVPVTMLCSLCTDVCIEPLAGTIRAWFVFGHKFCTLLNANHAAAVDCLFSLSLVSVKLHGMQVGCLSAP